MGGIGVVMVGHRAVGSIGCDGHDGWQVSFWS